MKTKDMTTLHLKNSVKQWFLIQLMFTCFGLAPMAQAVGPDTDGAIAGSNNGEGIDALVSRTTGIWNTGTGFEALNNLTAGNQNTATGLRALFSDINGGFNTATGVYSLFSNTSGFYNSATGAYSLGHNTTGSNNTANGYSALYFNTAGDNNTAEGFAALYKNTTGEANTAAGTQALYSNTTGSANTAIGDAALFLNTIGANNTANGAAALLFNTAGNNTATGYAALFHNTSGAFNSATGAEALLSNTSGSFNTADGYHALLSNTTGGFNVALGYFAGADITGTGNVCIGAGVHGNPAVDDTTWIKNVNTLTQNFAAGVNDYVTVRLTDGRLGHTAIVSSQRYKENIKPLAGASEVLYALKPVSFRLKKEYDETQALGFGLIAEEVEKVDAALVYRNSHGQAESVRYEMVNAMLLNEFLKEHKKVEAQNRRIQEQETVIAQLKKEMDALVFRVKEQDSKIQRVIDKIEIGKAAPQLAGGH
jgi:trimeric autotransporter adhesin